MRFMLPKLELMYPATACVRLWKPALVLQTLGVRQLTFAHRARALQCLLYLADKETIESLFKKPMEEVK